MRLYLAGRVYLKISFTVVWFACPFVTLIWSTYEHEPVRDTFWKGIAMGWNWPWEGAAKVGYPYKHGFHLVTDSMTLELAELHGYQA